MIKNANIFLFLLIIFTAQSQNIKTIQLKPLGSKQFTAIVPLGTVLQLSFDDLEENQQDYQYKIQHMTFDWQESNLLANQYINGFNQNSITNVSNSFNTLQFYTHYTVQIPNENTIITKSGNYLVSILNEFDEVLFSRRFTLYEKKVTVGVIAYRSRNTKTINKQQTVQFSINHPQLQINNPNVEIKVAVLQNNNWKTAITNLQPQFFKPNQLIYNYTHQSNFWGGNEYLFFDNKIIRNKSLNISKIILENVYHHYLYPFEYNEYKTYKYNPDINGQFIIRTLEGNNPQTEADYAMMHFSLQVDKPFLDDIYIYGAFNNFELNTENKMIFNKKNNTYQAKILLKQGFYNYTFVSKNLENTLNKGSIRGGFSRTENHYTVLVYYKPFGGLFERVIGVGTTIFKGEQ